MIIGNAAPFFLDRIDENTNGKEITNTRINILI